MVYKQTGKEPLKQQPEVEKERPGSQFFRAVRERGKSLLRVGVVTMAFTLLGLPLVKKADPVKQFTGQKIEVVSTNHALANPSEKIKLSEKNLLIFVLTHDEFKQIDKDFYDLLQKLAKEDFPAGVMADLMIFYYMRTSDNHHMVANKEGMLLYSTEGGYIWFFAPLKGDTFQDFKCKEEQKACVAKLTYPEDGKPGHILAVFYSDSAGELVVGLGEYGEDGKLIEGTTQIEVYDPYKIPKFR
ncbi:MAG: hypothetical protein GXN92_02190 [Candidatus Micrarchaeota archaeon]|nr:hypothetical protein [Candidatus Micrarchaeota archaeon]